MPRCKPPDPAKLAFGAGVEVFVRRGQLMMRILSPILPMLYRGFPLHPDDDNDPYIFRVDLSTFGFGIGTGRVIFSREHEVGTTAVHCEFGPLSFQKQPASKNPRLWAAVA